MSMNYEGVRNLSFEENKRYRIDFFGGIKAANVKPKSEDNKTSGIPNVCFLVTELESGRSEVVEMDWVHLTPFLFETNMSVKNWFMKIANRYTV